MTSFFRIFMAKVLFSSLLSCTCIKEGKKIKPIKVGLHINLHSLLDICKEEKKKKSCLLLSQCSAPYQLDTTKATNTQSVDDVEVG